MTGHNFKLWGTIGVMSDELRESDNIDGKKASAGPVLLAVAIVALILGGIFVASWISPAEENVTESDRVSRSVTDYVDAENRNDAETVKTLTCASFNSSTGPMAGVDGTVELKGVDGVVVNGDRARADVTITGGGAGERVSTWALTRDGNRWVVCN